MIHALLVNPDSHSGTHSPPAGGRPRWLNSETDKSDASGSWMSNMDWLFVRGLGGSGDGEAEDSTDPGLTNVQVVVLQVVVADTFRRS